jgi:hypothetical protein
MKTLIYIPKSKPYLWREQHYTDMPEQLHKSNMSLNEIGITKDDLLNGKVVASFEFDEWEEIPRTDYTRQIRDYTIGKQRTIINMRENYEYDECIGSCLTTKELKDYGKGNTLYAWHIKDLVVFDEVIELKELYKADMNDDFGSTLWYLWEIEQLEKEKTDIDGLFMKQLKEGLKEKILTTPPHPYQYVYYKGEKCLLISIRSEHAINILQGKKTLEIRKSVPRLVKEGNNNVD